MDGHGDRAELARWGIDAHRGVLFGRPSQPVLPALAVGWSAPLFGASLLAFLLVDALLGWRARR